VSETYDELLAIVTAAAHVCAFADVVAAAHSESAIKAEIFLMVNSLRYRKSASGS